MLVLIGGMLLERYGDYVFFITSLKIRVSCNYDISDPIKALWYDR